MKFIGVRFWFLVRLAAADMESAATETFPRQIKIYTLFLLFLLAYKKVRAAVEQVKITNKLQTIPKQIIILQNLLFVISHK